MTKANKGMPKPPKGWGMAYKHGAYYRIVRNKWIYVANDFDEAVAIVAVARKNEKQLKKAKAEDTRTIETLMDALVEDCKQRQPPLAKALSPATLKNYEGMASIIKSFLGANDVYAVDDVLLEEFRDGYGAKSPWMANNCINFLKSGYDFARVKLKWFPKDSVNPLRDVKQLKLEARSLYITDEQYIKVWEHAAPMIRVAMDLSLLTGMREGDIAKLHLSDLREDGLYVVQGKSKGKRKQLFEIGKPGTPEYNAALVAVISDAKAISRPVRSLYVLSSKRTRGTPVSSDFIYNGFKAAAVKAEHPEFHFHDIRAKFATDANDEGLDIQKSLGHASRAMSDRYVKLRSVERVQARNVILLKQRAGVVPLKKVI
jgi:integrase